MGGEQKGRRDFANRLLPRHEKDSSGVIPQSVDTTAALSAAKTRYLKVIVQVPSDVIVVTAGPSCTGTDP